MSNTLTINKTNKIQVVETVLVLAATLLIPFLIHLLPNIGGNIAGKVFLPLFIAPLVAVYLFRRHVALIAGLLAPLVNFVLFGRPATELVFAMSTELVLFVLLVSLIRKVPYAKFLAAPFGFAIASLAAACLLSLLTVVPSPVAFWVDTLLIGMPGILLLWMLNLVLAKADK